MKKGFIKFITLLLCLVTCGCVFTGCFKDQDPGEEIDPSKTQLNVAAYNGGAGAAWLNAIKSDFEALYADEHLEEGKTGVQVNIVDYDTNPISSIATETNVQVWFVPNVNYKTHIDQSRFVDISDIVDDVLPGETETILDKLDADMKAALTATNESGKYYCLPGFQGLGGVTYNKKTFDKYGFYFLDNPDGGKYPSGTPFYGLLLDNEPMKLSTGPDGIYGTDDDGLPSTVVEFKTLCTAMVSKRVTPFILYGQSQHYSQMLLQALWSNMAGYNGMMLNVAFDSTKYGQANLIDTSNYSVVATDIDSTNGYKLSAQAEKYYALDFMNFIFNANNREKNLINGSLQGFDSLSAQDYFLKGQANGKEMGMIIEGNWWESEARSNNKVKEDGDYDYRWMPMPVQYDGQVPKHGTLGEEGVTEKDGNPQTALECLRYYHFISAKAVEGKPVTLDLAKKFLQYCYTDKALQKATIATNMTLAVDYELTSDQVSGLTTYAKSLYNLKNNGKIVMGVSASSKFVNNMSEFDFSTLNSKTWASTTGYTYAQAAFGENVTVNAFFEGMIAQHNQSWWNGLS